MLYSFQPCYVFVTSCIKLGVKDKKLRWKWRRCRQVFKVVPMIIQSGNGCGSTVPMQKVSPKMGLLVARVLRHQNATAPKCYSTKVVPPAWRSLGGTQKHGWRLDEHKRSRRRNGNGDSEEIQTVIREKYKHRRHGELGLDWEEMGGGGKKLNIIEWEIYLGNLPRQKVPDNYFFPLERFVFPSVRKNEA